MNHDVGMCYRAVGKKHATVTVHLLSTKHLSMMALIKPEDILKIHPERWDRERV